MALKEKISELKIRYADYLPAIVLIGGFFVDLLTLRRVDNFLDNAILTAYLLVIGVSILLLAGRASEKVKKYARMAMLFSFGGAFSGLAVFYLKSVSLSASLLFFLLLIFLMIASEFRKSYYFNILRATAFYYVAVFSYLVVLVPVVLKIVGERVFVLSGLLSLLYIFLYAKLLKRFYTGEDKRKFFLRLWVLIIPVFTVITGMYFLRWMPPVPLALKDKGVYVEFLKKPDGEYLYEATYQKSLLGKRRKLVVPENKPVYVFTSVFAPTDLNTEIYHEWCRKGDDGWSCSDKIEIPIRGARGDGYRGFSYKSSLGAGRWKVVVKNSTGHILGVVFFRIELGEYGGKIRTEKL